HTGRSGYRPDHLHRHSARSAASRHASSPRRRFSVGDHHHFSQLNPMSQTRAPWLKWLLLVALIVAVALGVMRTLNKRKVQQQAAQDAAPALQAAAVFD